MPTTKLLILRKFLVRDQEVVIALVFPARRECAFACRNRGMGYGTGVADRTAGGTVPTQSRKSALQVQRRNGRLIGRSFGSDGDQSPAWQAGARTSSSLRFDG